MKKIYSTPHTEIVKIQTNRMIATSLPKDGSDENKVSDNEEVLSRRHRTYDAWGEEDEEEDY